MIKSKIEAREKALELAVELAKVTMNDDYDLRDDSTKILRADCEIIQVYAKSFEKYLIGSANLSEL